LPSASYRRRYPETLPTSIVLASAKVSAPAKFGFLLAAGEGGFPGHRCLQCGCPRLRPRRLSPSTKQFQAATPEAEPEGMGVLAGEGDLWSHSGIGRQEMTAKGAGRAAPTPRPTGMTGWPTSGERHEPATTAQFSEPYFDLADYFRARLVGCLM